eukprot:TRINITY_DN50181_c0_g1_i1.p1 TRINITY_DN50181_c0_g1~~TRINITY_DN50181_c0_g1_i1.p1  ORF type:complete len:455 (+),score=109.08 TRINITY_DN50181_c0_g1_i1:79-1365(+)
MADPLAHMSEIVAMWQRISVLCPPDAAGARQLAQAVALKARGASTDLVLWWLQAPAAASAAAARAAAEARRYADPGAHAAAWAAGVAPPRPGSTGGDPAQLPLPAAPSHPAPPQPSAPPPPPPPPTFDQENVYYRPGDITASVRRRPPRRAPPPPQPQPQTQQEPQRPSGQEYTLVKQAGKVGLSYLATTITKVTPGGAAEAAGLRAGMQLVAVAGRPVRTQSDVALSLGSAPQTFTVVIDSTEPGDSTASRQSSITSAGSGVPIADVSSAVHSFTLQAVEVGRQCIQAGLMARDDVEAQEPALFLGLPGLTMLECVLRSLEEENPLALRLANGTVVTPETFEPGDAAGLAIHAALVEGRRRVQALHFEADEVARLRRAVLHAEGDEGGTRSVEITRTASFFQSVATDISRLEPFHKAFNEVLGSLLQ